MSDERDVRAMSSLEYHDKMGININGEVKANYLQVGNWNLRDTHNLNHERYHKVCSPLITISPEGQAKYGEAKLKRIYDILEDKEEKSWTEAEIRDAVAQGLSHVKLCYSHAVDQIMLALNAPNHE